MNKKVMNKKDSLLKNSKLRADHDLIIREKLTEKEYNYLLKERRTNHYEYLWSFCYKIIPYVSESQWQEDMRYFPYIDNIFHFIVSNNLWDKTKEEILMLRKLSTDLDDLIK